MTSTQNQHPGRRDRRMDVAIRRWQDANPDAFFAGVSYDDRTGDVFIDWAPDGNRHRYTVEALRRSGHLVTSRIDAEDIDATLSAERSSLVERLRAHGLSAEPVGLNGDVVIRSTAIQALALINALDKLEAMIADREDGVS